MNATDVLMEDIPDYGATPGANDGFYGLTSRTEVDAATARQIRDQRRRYNSPENQVSQEDLDAWHETLEADGVVIPSVPQPVSGGIVETINACSHLPWTNRMWRIAAIALALLAVAIMFLPSFVVAAGWAFTVREIAPDVLHEISVLATRMKT